MDVSMIFLVGMGILVLLCLLGALVGHFDNLRRISNGTDDRLYYVSYDQVGQSLDSNRQKRPLR